MARHGKTTRRTVRRNAAYLQAFARLDAGLGRQILDQGQTDIEKINRLRRAVFGELTEDGPGDVNESQKSETIPAGVPTRARPLK